MTRHILFGAAAVLISLTAFADDEPNPMTMTPADRDQQRKLANAMVPTEEKHPVSWVGVGFEAGAGVGSFLDTRMAAQTGAAGQWRFRGIVGTRRHLAGEAAYIGGVQTVNALGVSQGATLMNHGFEGSFRYNLFTGFIQPYATGGLGYSHYTMGSAVISNSDVSSTGNVMTLPLSVGLAVKPGALIVDARLSVHPAVGQVLIRDTNMSTWDVAAHAGFEF
jgi:hypothetical protein